MLDFMWGYVMGQKSAAQAAAYARGVGAADAMATNMRLIGVDERIDRLTLLVEAMWSLMREHGYKDTELATRLMELDLTDGTMDGRRTAHPATCGSCGSKVAPGLLNCQFCGAEMAVPPDPFTAP